MAMKMVSDIADSSESCDVRDQVKLQALTVVSDHGVRVFWQIRSVYKSLLGEVVFIPTSGQPVSLFVGALESDSEVKEGEFTCPTAGSITVSFKNCSFFGTGVGAYRVESLK
jgi:hypothetical protein